MQWSVASGHCVAIWSVSAITRTQWLGGHVVSESVSDSATSISCGSVLQQVVCDLLQDLLIVACNLLWTSVSYLMLAFDFLWIHNKSKLMESDTYRQQATMSARLVTARSGRPSSRAHAYAALRPATVQWARPPARDPPAVRKHSREICASFTEASRRTMTLTFNPSTWKLAHRLLVLWGMFTPILAFSMLFVLNFAAHT